MTHQSTPRLVVLILGCIVGYAGCSSTRIGDKRAPGARDARATWTNGNKEGVGTAWSLTSKVWFTLANGVFDERSIVDAGFLELVRLGIWPADAPLITQSLAVVDRVLKVDTPNGPGWYRYNHDGYGEHADGRGYDGTGIGRLWPLLTGERGEYELAAGRDARPFLDALLAFANEGLMLPEQVWDRQEIPAGNALAFGKGTGSATPLAWTNAGFIRLALGVKRGEVIGTPSVVRAHFSRR